MLERLARFCFRRRGIVLIAWIGILLVTNIIANGVLGADYRADMSLPDSESKEVQDQLEAANPNRAGFTGPDRVRGADRASTIPRCAARWKTCSRAVDELDDVDVTSPYAPEGAQQISERAPIAFAELQVADLEYQEAVDLGTEIEELGDEVDVEGVTIEYGGDMFADFELPESEALGLLAAVIILLIAFGSVVAMGLPIITALFGLGTGVALTVIVSNVQSMPDFAPQLTAMIGLGVGIDYALFIVTRYREGLHAGLEPDDATAAAIDTSGRAVLFAGTTVIISLMGLYLMGLPFVRGLATGAALGVLVMMVAAVTLLPALIGFAGRRIEVTRYRGAIGMLVVTLGFLLAVLFGQGGFALFGIVGLVVDPGRQQDLRQGTAQGDPAPASPSRAKSRLWYRWSRRHPEPAVARLPRRGSSCCCSSRSRCSGCAWASATPAT